MTIFNTQLGVPSYTATANCGSSCQNKCAEFIIKRHDTSPDFKVLVEDCEGPLDLTSTQFTVEVNMWSDAKIKTALTASDTYFRLADDLGFDQIMQHDIIIIDRVRLPEQMLVTGFDETNKLIRVQRGYHGTTAEIYKKGQEIKIFRILNGVGAIESVYEDILNVDGTTTEDQLTETYLVYNWQALDTCVPGCFFLEFKLLRLAAPPSLQYNLIVPSFTPSTLTPADFGCTQGLGVEYERRFPFNTEGFTIQIIDSPSSEALL